ncbi:MAG: MBL fold metallo-hydrolase [Ignavibacteria bacterium]|nr:MAG: MBL fold metallo-hydrolase [Ignavibacteria bacterium]
MEIEFRGAARTVTGSMHVLHIAGTTVLLDCGLFQGKRDESNARNRTFPFDPRSITAVVLSHAHIDHSGNLPGLVKQGYTGPIFSTLATRDLCGIMLADSGSIQEKDAEFLNRKLSKLHQPPVEPLYTASDAGAAMKLFRGVPYGTPFQVTPNLTAEFFDAGHILGSASVKLTIKENGTTKKLGFTGDLGRRDMPILRDPVFMGDVEALISESTYGGKVHDPPEDMGNALVADLSRTIGRGGKIIVPAFSVGRTQDLVYSLHQLADAGKLARIPIFVDSPLAVNATDIYREHPECFDDDTYKVIQSNRDPFGLGQLRYIRSVEESIKLNELKGPCMIISASGMCEAGRILHHLANNIEDSRNTILIVGYQAEHTLGKRLVDQEDEVKIFGKIYRRKAEVVVHNAFSAHADGNELMAYIGQFKKSGLSKVFLVHGEYVRAGDLQRGLNERGYASVEIPERGQKFGL